MCNQMLEGMSLVTRLVDNERRWLNELLIVEDSGLYLFDECCIQNARAFERRIFGSFLRWF